MFKFRKVLPIALIVFCLLLVPLKSVFAAVASGTPLWAQSTVTAPDRTYFNGVSSDSAGNSYAVGFIHGTIQFDFGNGATVTGGNAGNNALFVKYNSAGVAQWVKTATTAPDQSVFTSVSTDSAGNSYATGYIIGTVQFDFGNGATVTGGNASWNTVIVKYNSAGVAQWAKTALTAPNYSTFDAVSTDSAGNSYATGYINGTSQFDFGNGATVTGGNAGNNAVTVKYNSAGVAQWAKAALTAPNSSHFYGISSDSSGNSYATGYIRGTSQFDFGNGATVSGGNASNSTIIVKYNSAGVAQWAKTAATAPDYSTFDGVSSDSFGNSYAVGSIQGTSQFDFGNGATVTGGNAGNSTIIVKYNSAGVAQWAKTATTAPDYSSFDGVSTDSAGNSYVVGYISGSIPFDYGNGVTVSGGGNDNTLVVKYNSAGVAQWAKTTLASPDYAEFYGVSIDSSGNIYAVGEIDSTSQFDFGNGATVTGGNASGNTVIVKYAGETVTPVTPVTPTSPSSSTIPIAPTSPSSSIIPTLPATGVGPISDEKDISNVIVLFGIFVSLALIYIARKKQRSQR